MSGTFTEIEMMWEHYFVLYLTRHFQGSGKIQNVPNENTDSKNKAVV